MRTALVALVLLASTEARAGDYVADWVGTWNGSATWKDCSVPGGDTLSVAVSWRDGTLFLDGAAIYDGLGEVAPEVGDDGALGFDSGDLQGRIVRTKRGATITFSTAAQCTMSAKLTRAGSGIEACDGLVALASAASSCEVALDDDPASEVAGWRALTGAKRKAAGARCSERAAALEKTLIANDCVPPEHDPADQPQCRAVWRAAERVMRCAQAPAEYKLRTRGEVAALRRSLHTLDPDVAAQYCDDTASMLVSSADALHCP